MQLNPFKKKAKQPKLNLNEAMAKAMQSPDYNDNLRKTVERTLLLNAEELPHVEELLADLQNNPRILELPISLHNFTLVCRQERTPIVPILIDLFRTMQDDIKNCTDKETKEQYQYCKRMLKRVEKEDTHPIIVYHDLSTFLTSFIVINRNLRDDYTQEQVAILQRLQNKMIEQTTKMRDLKKQTIDKCHLILQDLKKSNSATV